MAWSFDSPLGRTCSGHHVLAPNTSTSRKAWMRAKNGHGDVADFRFRALSDGRGRSGDAGA